MSTVRGSGKILWLGLVASIVAGGIVVFVAVRKPSPHVEKASVASDVGAPSATSVVSASNGPAAAVDAAAADPTKIDRVMQGPFTKEFTPEQEARLAALRKEFGELQSQIAVAQRDEALLRTQAIGLPGIREHVEAMKAARAEMQAAVMSRPDRQEAQARLGAAEPRETEMRERFESFRGHVDIHCKASAIDPDTECEWCRRDSARIAARDPALGRGYQAEGKDLFSAYSEADEALRKARIELARIVREAPASEEVRPIAERMAAAQKAMNEALATVPDLVQLRDTMAAARSRQRELTAEILTICRQARVVFPPVAKQRGAE